VGYPREVLIPGGPGGRERPARLLLVDDDANLLVVLAEQLRADGYDVATARDGVEALRRLENAWPDLVLLDMMMPRLDGISLAREIKAHADLPIIVLTAIDAADSKAELLDEVAEDYVTKPYHYPELRARINRVLRRLGDRLPGQRIVLGPGLALELGRRAATVNGTDVSLTPTESGQDRPDRDARGPRLGGHGRRRSLVRLGHDAAAPPEDRAGREPAAPPDHRPRDRLPPGGGLDVIPFRIRITAALLIAALTPLAAFGALLVITGRADSDGSIFRILLTAFVIAALLGVGIAFVVAGSLTAPLRALATALDRIAAGDTSTPLPALADDELGRLAERQNQLAADLLRRNRQVARVVDAVGTYSPREGADHLVDLAIADARAAFGLIDARIVLGNPSVIAAEERVPGDPLPVHADLRAGAEPLGALVGHASATARWDRADQDLLELFAAFVGVGLRNAELFARVADQNERLRELDAAKDDFLRGVSHNLQTPLARIRAYADQLAAEVPDRRLGIIAEQSDRLSRMVRQLLTVSRLDSGVLRPVAEVFALGPRVRRAWEALGASGVPFTLDDRAGGWLALADPDQVDQVIWGLLDNAVKYGGGTLIIV
jgi:CheY-like chemotaxis protein/GAF domain-containing protein